MQNIISSNHRRANKPFSLFTKLNIFSMIYSLVLLQRCRSAVVLYFVCLHVFDPAPYV